MTRDYRNLLVQITLAAGVLVTVLTTAAVLVLLIKESIVFFSHVSLAEFFTGTKWTPLLEPKHFGVLPLIMGTLMVGLGAIAIATPAGIFIALFLSEFASPRSQSVFKPVLEILAGIPTVVYGYFAITFVTPLLREIYPKIQIFNALSATIVVAIMIIPMISSLCDDAFRALPKSLKEGGYALGATTLEVARDVLVPAASGRIIASVLLALSRAVGETMAVTLAAGSRPNLDFDYLESIQTMTAFIVQVSLGDTPAGGPEYLSAFAVGTTLFVITMIMNGIGSVLIIRTSKKAISS